MFDVAKGVNMVNLAHGVSKSLALSRWREALRCFRTTRSSKSWTWKAPWWKAPSKCSSLRLGLEVLKIGGAGEISGDIKVFEHTPNLKVLALNATALEGDMEVFSVYTKGIRQLSLINALRVTGHLPNLLKHRTFHNLKKFVLINSSGVTGSLKHFLAAKKLQEMRIENAEYINGDLSLLPIPSLRSLILKGITMEVDFTALDRKYRMKNPQFNLSELHLEPEVETSGSTRLLKLPARRQSRLAGV